VEESGKGQDEVEPSAHKITHGEGKGGKGGKKIVGRGDEPGVKPTVWVRKGKRTGLLIKKKNGKKKGGIWVENEKAGGGEEKRAQNSARKRISLQERKKALSQ